MALFKTVTTTLRMLDSDEPIPGALLGRGVVNDVEPTGTSVGAAGFERHFCRITLSVALDGADSYTAVCTHKLHRRAIAQLRPGATAVAVEVDPTDRSHVRVVWDEPAPIVRAAR